MYEESKGITNLQTTEVHISIMRKSMIYDRFFSSLVSILLIRGRCLDPYFGAFSEYSKLGRGIDFQRDSADDSMIHDLGEGYITASSLSANPPEIRKFQEAQLSRNQGCGGGCQSSHEFGLDRNIPKPSARRGWLLAPHLTLANPLPARLLSVVHKGFEISINLFAFWSV
ncbi:hypothetical protein CPB84DRAFT_1749549 [Gymnopilus junonius]|uniref:Uncharacterized protein n=1 Tax=Gymnopilus junonius TaxID=109634 RepID=A0A9P5TJF5_GYMJU|nr:hypothetical protein CPB84DRAFT_1749549 [Gymnopilus junonius]